MVLLVTGCRSGFGLLTAITAARAGHTVYAGLRDLDTAGALRESGLPSIVPVQLDVTSAEEQQAVVQRILDEHGHVDALVNNAGVAVAGPIENLDDDELRHMFEVNVFGLFSLTNRVLPHMRERRSGLLVNVSSMAGRMALPCLGGYAASKHAVTGMSEALRHEVRDFGVRVVVVEPGPYATDILTRNQRVSRRTGIDGDPYAELVGRVQRLADRAMGRAGDPQEVADTIVALLEQPSPPRRIALGPTTRVRRAARWLLPDRAFEAVMARVIARG